MSILYHHFPHYRAPVLRALARSARHHYSFFGSHDDFQGIRAFTGDGEICIQPIGFHGNEATGRIAISGFDRAASCEFDAMIMLGNPHVIGSWRAVLRARRRGLATLFWAHGWLRKDPFWKAKLRNLYYSRADRVMTYGARAIEIAAASGFDARRISVIWNSLDWQAQSRLFDAHHDTPLPLLRDAIGMPQGVPIVATISRVTPLVRYDLLIEAVAKLRAGGQMAEIWMIGDGPEVAALAMQAKARSVPLHLQGAIYDETVIARHIMAADLVASPGKVGLTAMHALAYGTPVVTHGELDRQMPEVEAITGGLTGAFFDRGDAASLAVALSSVLVEKAALETRREACRAALRGRFTPEDQARRIDDAVDEVLDAKTQR